MITNALVTAVINEWWTGLTADGKESPLIRWQEVAGMRSRVLDVADLAALLARSWDKGDGHVRVRLALGVDENHDVRVELEEKDEVQVLRWRPRDGDLLDVFDRGVTPRRMGRRAGGKRIDQVFRLEDFDARKLEDTSLDIAALKALRIDLLDRAEVSDEAAIARLAEVDAKLTEVRERHDEANAEAKAELLAKEAEDAATPDAALEEVFK